MLCTSTVLNVKTKEKTISHTTCSEVYFWRNSMNNLLSYFGLTDARMGPSEKDLPVLDNIPSFKKELTISSL